MSDAYFWAVVGDGNPEPVGVKGDVGMRQAFTLGCPDPYFIDEPGCPCRLLPELGQAIRDNHYIAKIEELPPEPLEVPENTLSPKVRRALEKSFRAQLAPKHGYTGFGRAASGTPTRRAETSSGSVGEADGGPAPKGDAQQ